MKTKFAAGNPFIDHTTWGYSYESIPSGGVLLDFGCFEGEFIDRLAKAKRVTVYGVDKDRDAIARYRGPHTVRVFDGSIPFPDATFDIVTMFDVIEHIHDQNSILLEIHRVLKFGGLLVITTPRRHIFSFLDLGNLKYSFPRLHKFWYTRRHSLEEYNYRYVDNPSGLIGNVEKEKYWHQHFRDEELVDLLVNSGFEVDDIDPYGLFGDVMTFLGQLGMGFLFPEKVRHWDDRTFASRQFCCRFSKPA